MTSGVVYDPRQAVNGLCKIIQSYNGNFSKNDPRSFLETETYDPTLDLSFCVDVSGSEHVLAPLSDMPLAWEAESKHVVGVPQGAQARILTDLFAVDDGIIDMSHHPADTYIIEVWAIGYLKGQIEVTV